jgi:arylsulfatase A-like enzyme
MLPLYADGVTTAVSRREFLSALSASAAFAKAPPLPAPWNFVFVLMDDLGWADIGPFANHVIDTPNLNRFASQSVRFTNAYAACPVCSPTRASILTGRYPARFHLTDWIPARKQWPYAKLLVPQFAQNLPKQEVTFAEKLKGRGYRSAAIGKWHLGGAGFLPTDQGFDLNIAGNAAGSPPSYFGPLELPGLTLKNGEFLTDRLINEANRFIRTNASNPFCLYLAHFTVHLPLEAPKELVDKYRRKKTGDIDPVYCAMVESADAALGNLLEAVDASPNAQRTVVIFFSDNGGVRFQERRPKPVTTNAPLRAGKGHLYEGGIREPLLIRWPGVAREGITLLTPVSSIDFFPTICATAGLSAGTVDGVDLAPLFRGQSLPERPLRPSPEFLLPQGRSESNPCGRLTNKQADV